MAWLRELGEPWIILKRNWHLIYPSISVYRDWVMGKWKDDIIGRRKKCENGVEEVKYRHSWKAGSHICLEQTLPTAIILEARSLFFFHMWVPSVFWYTKYCFSDWFFKKLNIFKKGTSYQHVVENTENEILCPQLTRNCVHIDGVEWF